MNNNAVVTGDYTDLIKVIAKELELEGYRVLLLLNAPSITEEMRESLEDFKSTFKGNVIESEIYNFVPHIELYASEEGREVDLLVNLSSETEEKIELTDGTVMDAGLTNGMLTTFRLSNRVMASVRNSKRTVLLNVSQTLQTFKGSEKDLLSRDTAHSYTKTLNLGYLHTKPRVLGLHISPVVGFKKCRDSLYKLATYKETKNNDTLYDLGSGTMEDIAVVVRYLASKEFRGLSGKTFHVDKL